MEIALNSIDPNIKLTIEVNPEKFSDAKIILYNDSVVTAQVYQKRIRKLYLWFLKFQKEISERPFQGICIDLEK